MSCGKRRRRPRKCTSSKCREVFARIGGCIKFGRLCVFRFYCVFFVVYCVFLCCGFCVVVCLRLFFFHGEARMKGVTHFKKRAGLRMWSNPIASLMSCSWRWFQDSVWHHVVPIPSDARQVLCWIICCGLSWKRFLIDNRSFGCVVWRLAIWFNVILSYSFAGSHQHGRFCVWCNSTHYRRQWRWWVQRSERHNISSTMRQSNDKDKVSVAAWRIVIGRWRSLGENPKLINS